MTSIGTKVGAEFKAHRLRIEGAEADITTLGNDKANAADVYDKATSDARYEPADATIVKESELKTINGNSIVGSGDISVLDPIQPYGVTWDQNGDIYNRIGGTDFTYIQRQMKRCTLLDNGTVNYYLSETNSNYKEDGSAAVLDGTDGDVMVEIPKFYYKYSYKNGTHSHMINLLPFDGATVHPAFVDNGSEIYKIYIAAYAMDANGRSVSGSYPKVSQTRDGARTTAKSNGSGWGHQDFNTLSAVQLLMLVEFADFNSQEVIGMGRTQLSGGSWAPGSYHGIAGRSNSIGNGTGAINYAGDADDAAADAAFMSYRGIEDFYGNVWTFVDGINIQDYVPYISNNSAGFADDVFSGDYVSAGITMSASSGYQNTLANSSKGFFPDTIGAGSSTKIGDYYWQNSGNRIMLSGGAAHHGLSAGAFYLHAGWRASDSDVDVGARSQFKKA
jgi:hypothetical protein